MSDEAAHFCAAVLAEIYLCNVCPCQEILSACCPGGRARQDELGAVLGARVRCRPRVHVPLGAAAVASFLAAV
jgi:hypothetical protein